MNLDFEGFMKGSNERAFLRVPILNVGNMTKTTEAHVMGLVAIEGLVLKKCRVL